MSLPMSKLIAVTLTTLLFTSTVAADTPPPPDPDAQRLAAATAEKAEWDARKARLDYQNAAGPASGLTNAVDIKDKAGSMEAALLFGQSLYPIADVIVADVDKKAGDAKIVVLGGNATADMSLWEMFEARTGALSTAFDALDQGQDVLDDEYRRLIGAPASAAVTTASRSRSAVAGIAAGAQALTKAFSYFASDYAAGGIDLTEDDEIVVSAIAARASGKFLLYRPTQVAAHDTGAKDIYGLLSALGERAESRRAWLVVAKERSARLTKLSESAKGTRAAELKDLAAAYSSTATEATGAIDRYTALITAISSTAADNPFPLSAIVRQRALAELLDSSSFVLFVTTYSAGGGYFSRKNILTTFGAMPFYASGGAVVHYRLVARADSHVATAGVVSFACAYRKVSKVASGKVEPSCIAVPPL